MTFSVPADTVVTIKGEYWQRTEDIVCDQDDTLSVDFCSPSLAVVQGTRLSEFYRSDKNAVLAKSKPKIKGWSSFSHRIRTKSNRSKFTLYLMQESAGPLSSSYFANLQIERHRVSTTTSDSAPIALVEGVPLKINCGLPGWKIHNAVRLCNISHYGRENVLALDDGGIRYGGIKWRCSQHSTLPPPFMSPYCIIFPSLGHMRR